MTDRLDVARGCDIVARWCALAEQRLEYLTELFETGRWRRFHSESAFLDNIQEAKAAVQTWRELLSREASHDNTAIDISWLGRANAAPRGVRWRDPVRLPQPVTAKIAAEPPPEISIAPPTGGVAAAQAPSAQRIDDEVLAPPPGIAAIAERYPLLRNAL